MPCIPMLAPVLRASQGPNIGNANNQPKSRANDNAGDESRNLAFKRPPLNINVNAYFVTVVARPSGNEKSR